MGLLQAAYRTYEAYADRAGSLRDGEKEALTPISHIVINAQIEITLSKEGVFQSARTDVYKRQVLGVAGTFLFALSVITMKDSWRAGLAENDETEMITNGIYALSRNPAFLGFDCVYVGFVLMFFNVPLLLFSVFAMVMLHLQILQEEQYLIRVFGDTYLHYKSKVCRYFGRKR